LFVLVFGLGYSPGKKEALLSQVLFPIVSDKVGYAFMWIMVSTLKLALAGWLAGWLLLALRLAGWLAGW
jgi:hypothetical protein